MRESEHKREHTPEEGGNLIEIQLNMPLPNQIVQPSGCCDKDIHPALQRIYLRVLGYAAKNHLCSQPQIASVCPEIFRNL